MNAVTGTKLEDLSKDEMGSSFIDIPCGTWTFTMTGMVGEVTFKAVITKDIKIDGDTFLTFSMKPVDESGNELTTGTLDLSLTIEFFEGTNKNKNAFAFISIKKNSDGSIIENEKLLGEFESGQSVKYSNAMGETGVFTDGTYDIKIDFYGDEQKTVKLNNWEAYARIVPGYVTKAEITGYNLNEVYTIGIYNREETDEIATDSPASVIPLKYSRKSEEIVLPYYKRDGWYFEGWYTKEPFEEENKIEKINPHLTVKDIDIYARWRSTTIWVKDGGEGSGEREDLAVSSIEKACQKIKEVYELAKTLTEKDGGTYATETFTIKISGEVQGLQTVPETLTNEFASGVIIKGKGGDEPSDTEDVLKPQNGGTVLSVKTGIPVTIRNLKITGGSAEMGGGILLYDGSDLTLSDGAVLEGNRASSKGGAVYFTGSSVFKMNGSAYIPYGGEPKNNDVYLENTLSEEAVITVNGSLNPPEGSRGCAATVTPQDYGSIGSVLLAADSGVTLADENGKFDVSQPEAKNDFLYIDDEGQLTSVFSFENGVISGNKTTGTELLTDEQGNEVGTKSFDIEYIEVEKDKSLDYAIAVPDGVTLVVLKDCGGAVEKNLAASGTLAKGDHTLVAEFSRGGSASVSVKRYIRIVQELQEPEIKTNGNNTGTKTDGGTTYEVIEYSYLDNDNLTYEIEDKENVGAVVKLKIGGTAKTLSGSMADGYNTLEISVTKENYLPKTFTENIYVKIKRVYVTVGKIAAYNTDGGNHVDLCGSLYAGSDASGTVTLASFNKTKVSKNHDVWPWGHTIYLDTKESQYFYFWTDGMEDYDKGSSNDYLGRVAYGNVKRNLKGLKSNKGFYAGSDSDRSHYSFSVSLSELPQASIEFTPSLTGGADSEGYEYIEVEKEGDTVTYKISTSETGVSLSGTVDSVTFTGAKNGTLNIGKHTITVKSTKNGKETNVEKKIIVVQALKKPTLRIWNGTSNVTADSAGAEDAAYSDYHCYNVNLTVGGTLGTVEYAVDAESGVTVDVTVDNEENNREATDKSLALGPHTLTVVYSKEGHATKEFETKVYIQGILGESSINFYKETSHTTKLSSTSPENSTYSSYTTYDVELDADGTCALYYLATPANTGSTVKVIENDAELSGKLTLGPHTITVKSTRQYCASNSFEKKIYVQGVLSEPTFTPDGTKVKTVGTTEYWQYSYIKYDKMPIEVTAGNTGNTVKLYMDGHEVEKASLGYGTAGSVSVTQTRQYCKSLDSESKWMDVSIKPITLTYEANKYTDGLQVEVQGFQGTPGSNMCIRGEIHVKGLNTNKEIWHFEGTYQEATRNQWSTIVDTDGSYRYWSDTFTSPLDTIQVTFHKFRRDKEGKDIQFSSSDYHDFPKINLSDIKDGKGENSSAGTSWTYVCDIADHSGDKARPKIRFTPSDD